MAEQQPDLAGLEALADTIEQRAKQGLFEWAIWGRRLGEPDEANCNTMACVAGTAALERKDLRLDKVADTRDPSLRVVHTETGELGEHAFARSYGITVGEAYHICIPRGFNVSEVKQMEAGTNSLGAAKVAADRVRRVVASYRKRDAAAAKSKEE